MPEGDIIQLIPAGELPGRLRKRLTVPEDHVALLLEGNALVGQRGPGEHSLGNWPRAAPDVLLLSLAPFDLRPRMQHLRSGDQQPLDLVWPLTLQIDDPERFYEAWLAAGPLATALPDLEDHLAGLLWDDAQKGVVQFALDDLRAKADVQSGLGRDMRAKLTAAFRDLGLALVGSQRPQPHTLGDERATLEATNQVVRAARDARFEALFERLEDREMLEHHLTEWCAERGEEPPDQALVDLIWQGVEQGPEEAAIRAEQAAQALERQVASLRMTAHSERTENERRFRQLVTRLEKVESAQAETEEHDPVRWLKWVLFLLRLAGTGLALLAALIALLAPHMTEEYLRVRGVALLIAFVVGILTLISELFLRRRIRSVRHEMAERKRAESRASLKRRRQADRLVRARVEAGLKQVVNSLEGAWKKAYSAGGAARDLAAGVREVARQTSRFEEQEVRAANYQAGRYLAYDGVPDDQLGAVLDLDDDLLARSRSLAQTAEGLYEQVNAGQVEPARLALRDLENGLNALCNRFVERGAYLMDLS